MASSITLPNLYRPVTGVPLTSTQGGGTTTSKRLQSAGQTSGNVTGVPLTQTYTNAGTLPNANLGTSTANPQNLSYAGDTSGGGSGPNLSYTGAGGDGGAAAAQAAKVDAARAAIQTISKSILDVYNSLYPQIDTAGADQAKNVNNKYDVQGKGLIDQFNLDFPKIGNAFSSRGAFDSSYRQDAETGAQNALTNEQTVQGQGRQEDLAKVGQFVAGAKAKVGADASGINAILGHIGQTTDVNELQSLQAAIQQKLADTQVTQAQLGTTGGYAAQAQSLVPAADQTGQLQQNLSAILAGQANPALKRSIAVKLVQTSGISPDQQQKLLSDFEAQLPQTG